MEVPVSIVIPTLNEEKYLRKLLESIKNSTVQPLEVRVADSDSRDGTRKVAKEYGAIVVDDERKGPGAGRNKGAEGAKGEYILFLDSDVILPHNFLETAMNLIKKDNLVIASAFIRPIGGNAFQNFVATLGNIYFYWISFLVPHAGGYCILVKREIHEKIKGFDTTLFMGEDHEYSKRARKYGKFGFIKNPLLWVSTRRFKEEGVLKTASKYFLSELYTLFLGKQTKGRFSFQFGEHFKD